MKSVLLKHFKGFLLTCIHSLCFIFFRVTSSCSCVQVQTVPSSSRCRSPGRAECSAAAAVKSSGTTQRMQYVDWNLWIFYLKKINKKLKILESKLLVDTFQLKCNFLPVSNAARCTTRRQTAQQFGNGWLNVQTTQRRQTTSAHILKMYGRHTQSFVTAVYFDMQQILTVRSEFRIITEVLGVSLWSSDQICDKEPFFFFFCLPVSEVQYLHRKERRVQSHGENPTLSVYRKYFWLQLITLSAYSCCYLCWVWLIEGAAFWLISSFS